LALGSLAAPGADAETGVANAGDEGLEELEELEE
jgi:hypothetical protein